MPRLSLATVSVSVLAARARLLERPFSCQLFYSVLSLTPAPPPLQATLPERRAYLAAEAARLAAAPSVTIVGGGPSGAELAGEILSEYPKKRVTVVHPGGALLAGAAAGNTLTPALGDAVTRRLAKMGATLVLNDRVARNGDRSFGATTEKGKDVGSAVVYDATGSRPLTAWANAPGSLAALKLDGAGRVVVTRELTLPGCGSVFALGDAAATGDQPMGYFAGLQAQLVVANLLASVASKPLKALKASPSDMMLVALGRSDGVLHAPGGFLFQGCLPACVKSGGLFVGKVRGEHGV